MKITKKEFIKLLSTRRSALVYASGIIKSEETLNNGIECLIATSSQMMSPARNPINTNSVRILFDNGSSLVFDSIGECYKENNLLYTIKSWYDVFDEKTEYKVMAYLIEEA